MNYVIHMLVARWQHFPSYSIDIILLKSMSYQSLWIIYKPSHLLIRHSILNLSRHLANGDLNYIFPISAMLILQI